MKNFPLNHVVKDNTKEIWVECNSSVTAMGISSLVKKYYPGYKLKIATEKYLNILRGQFEN